MNTSQKFVTFVALAAFAITLIFSPWQIVQVRQDAFPSLALKTPVYETIYRYKYGPIWSGPGDYSAQIKLRYGVLFAWWFAVAVLYLGFLFLLKTKQVSKDHSGSNETSK